MALFRAGLRAARLCTIATIPRSWDALRWGGMSDAEGVVVTGAGHGIGRATALRLAAPVSFTIYDADGGFVSSGLVSDPAVTLRAGRYTVVVETALGKISIEVSVLTEKETRVEVEYTDGVFRARVL